MKAKPGVSLIVSAFMLLGAACQSAPAAAAWMPSGAAETTLPSLLIILAVVSLFCLA